MNDRELLEAAAKAAGLEWSQRIAKEREALGLISLWVTTPGHVHTAWNPLDDDGAALRLAVKLKIEPHFMEGGGTDAVRCDENGNESVLAAEIDSDPYAATRRAIVRAAASLQDPQESRDV